MKDWKTLTRHGWMTAATIVPLVFAVYYLFVYPWLSQTYKEMFWTPAAVTRGEGNAENIEIAVNAPKFIADFVPRELIVEASSSMTETVTLTISVSEKIEVAAPGRPQVRIQSNPKEEGKADISTSALELTVPPHGSAVGKLWIDMPFQKTDDEDVKLQFFKNNDSVPLSLNIGPPTDGGESKELVVTFNRLKAFRQSAIKNLLLPPWSNGVLLALSLALIWFAEGPAARIALQTLKHMAPGTLCSHCDQPLPEEARVCPHCGKDVAAATGRPRIMDGLKGFWLAPGRLLFLSLLFVSALFLLAATMFLWAFVVSEDGKLTSLALALLFVLALWLAPYIEQQKSVCSDRGAAS